MFYTRTVMSPVFLKCLFIFIVCVNYGKPQQSTQLNSPCPRLFIYDSKNSVPGKWFGFLTLLSDTDLNGIWLRLILDRPSVQLGNWFGEVTSTDNKEFLIKNRNFALKAHTPHIVRFFIKYDVKQPVPQLTSFRLNAKTLCPENVPQTAPEFTSELQTSSSNIPQPTPKPPINNGGSNTHISGIPGGFNPSSSSAGSDEEFFPGDFNTAFHEDSSDRSGGNSDANCGTVSIKSKSQGQSTVEGEFPWHASLYYVKGINLAYICSATLISKDHVISAAHCLTQKQSKTALNPDNLLVYLSKQHLRRFSNTGIQDRQTGLIIIHPNYNPQTLENDLGIVRLTPSADITDYVRPICLWQDSDNLNSIINKPGTITGWGYDETGKITDQLTQTKLSPVSAQTCTSFFQSSSNAQYSSNNGYCAKFGSATPICVGNSGSGMFFSKSNGGRTTWQIRGVVALNVALQTEQKCDPSQYVLFVDIAKYLDWIKQAMRRVV